MPTKARQVISGVISAANERIEELSFVDASQLGVPFSFDTGSAMQYHSGRRGSIG
jgi:hypothetical protein